MKRAVKFASFFSTHALESYVGLFGYCLLDQVLIVSPSHPDPGLKEKINLFIFTLLCGTSKGFLVPQKAIMAFIKLFEVPERSVKIIFKLFFILNFFLENLGQ